MPIRQSLAKAGEYVSNDQFIGGRYWRHSLKLEDQEKLMLGGARISVAGGTVHYVPELSHDTFGRIRFGLLPAATGHEAKFGRFVEPGSRDWTTFMATRKLVQRPNLHGPGGLVSVASNLGDKINANELVNEPVLTGYDVQGIARKRKYQLAQVLTDSCVRDKFGLSTSFMSSVRTLAVADADAAASRLQEAMNAKSPDVKVTVSAGAYSRTRGWARSSIAQYTSKFSPISVTVDAMVIGKKIYLYGWETEGDRWSVSGPLAYSSEVYDVHKAVCMCGTSAPMFALGSECTILGIDIYNGFTHESPSVEYHIGSPNMSLLPRASSPVTSGKLSATGKVAVAAMALKMEPVVSAGGITVATCVRVSKGYALVNSHVLDENPGLRISGEPVSAMRLLARDLWLVKCAGGEEVAWPLRDAKPGEEVIICYRAGESVQYTSPVTVRSCDGVAIVMSRDSSLAPGMSGGAIIALRDMALLGVYEGSGPTQAIGAVFGQAHFTDIYSTEEVESEGRSAASANGEDSIYHNLRLRGLKRYADCVMISMIPIYAATGEHVGLGYRSGAVLRTTVNPDVGPLRVDASDALPSVFEAAPPFSYETSIVAGSISGPMVYRKPSYFEKVVVVGRDGKSPYFSKTTRVVHVGVGSKNFVVEDTEDSKAFPFVGGLVMSLADCAVVGQYVKPTTASNVGSGAFCYTIEAPTNQVPVELSLEAVVSRAFPVLSTTLWPPELLNEVFSRTERGVGERSLVQVGRAAIHLTALGSMRSGFVPVEKWPDFIQTKMSLDSLRRIALNSGLAARVGTSRLGDELPVDSPVRADVVLALAGAVYEIETDDVFWKLCSSLGFVYSESEVDILASSVSDGGNRGGLSEVELETSIDSQVCIEVDSERVYDVEISYRDTVGDIKAKFRKKCGLLGRSVIFSLEGEVLSDLRTLNSYGWSGSERLKCEVGLGT